MNIGIIGSAGRGDTIHLWNSHVWLAAHTKLCELLPQDEPVHLHSGGASWADHLAVGVFMSSRAEKLTLHIPCAFITGAEDIDCPTAGPIPGFEDDGTRSFITNPGGTLNYYHKRFSEKMNGNSLNGIAKAKTKGARLICEPYRNEPGNRLLKRNLGIGKDLHLLIAFTWGSGTEPDDGGTAHCWKHSSAPKKIHIPLHTLA